MGQKGIFSKLLLLFTVIPILELYILVKIANMTDWMFTILLVIFTGIMGAYLAKQQGQQIISRIQLDLDNGRMPQEELINGLCVLVGGVLLVTPGIITDILGFTLIIPITRYGYKRWIGNMLKDAIKRKAVNVYYYDN